VEKKAFDILDSGPEFKKAKKTKKETHSTSKAASKIAASLKNSELWNSNNNHFATLREEIFLSNNPKTPLSKDGDASGAGEGQNKKGSNKRKMKKVSDIIHREGGSAIAKEKAYEQQGGEIDFNFGLQPLEDTPMPSSVPGLGVGKKSNDVAQPDVGKQEMKDVYRVLSPRKPDEEALHALMGGLKSLDGRRAFSKELAVSRNVQVLVSSDITRLSILNGWILDCVETPTCEDFVCSLLKLILVLNLDLSQIKESKLGKTMKLKLKKHQSKKVTRQASRVMNSWVEKATQAKSKQKASLDQPQSKKDNTKTPRVGNHPSLEAAKKKNIKKDSAEEAKTDRNEEASQGKGTACGQLSKLLRDTVEDKKLLRELSALGQEGINSNSNSKLGEESAHLADLMLGLVKALPAGNSQSHELSEMK
jgi:hypothetical protein